MILLFSKLWFSLLNIEVGSINVIRNKPTHRCCNRTGWRKHNSIYKGFSLRIKSSKLCRYCRHLHVMHVTNVKKNAVTFVQVDVKEWEGGGGGRSG